MKKLLLLGLLSAAAISMSASSADACWYLGCWRDRCCHRCSTSLTIYPYNAFSPVAYGSICADGCCPLSVSGGCLPPRACAPGYGGPPAYGPGYGGNGYCGNGYCGEGYCGNGYCGNGCCDGGPVPGPGPYDQSQPAGPVGPQMTPTQPVPQVNPGQQFQAPNPQIINQSSRMVPMQPAYGYVQPAGYYQGAQPMYNPYAPNYYYPPQAPNYWYGR